MPKGVYDHSILAKSPNRFWDFVEKTPTCWLWTRGKTTAGYGIFTLHKREQHYAHRWSYEQLVGSIPKGYILDHKCHNPACVNPAHLRVCKQANNLMNTRRRVDNKSGFKGVSRGRDGRWVAQIQYKGRHYNLGTAPTAELAHLKYLRKAEELFGDFTYAG